MLKRLGWRGLAVGIVAGLLVSGTISWAAVPDSLNGTISACYPTSGPNKGALRVIDHQAGRACKAGEAMLVWPTRGFRFRGAWTNSTAYAINDVVVFSGSTYIAQKATTNVLPSSVGYWALMASGGKGAQGPQGGTGDAGPPGGAGPQGVAGPQGGSGLPGADGGTGLSGLPGAVGGTGLQGPAGTPIFAKLDVHDQTAGVGSAVPVIGEAHMLSATVLNPAGTGAVAITFDRDVSQCAVAPFATNKSDTSAEATVISASGAAVSVSYTGSPLELDVTVMCF